MSQSTTADDFPRYHITVEMLDSQTDAVVRVPVRDDDLLPALVRAVAAAGDMHAALNGCRKITTDEPPSGGDS